MRYFLWNFFEKNTSYWTVIMVMVASLIKEVRSWNTEPIWEASFATASEAPFLAGPEECLIHLEKPTPTRVSVSVAQFTEDLEMEAEGAGFVTVCPVFLWEAFPSPSFPSYSFCPLGIGFLSCSFKWWWASETPDSEPPLLSLSVLFSYAESLTAIFKWG